MVRISQIELFDFKNIEYGKIVFPKTFKNADSSIGADVVGIYGQNGSGKTSVVQALKLIKTYISGYSLLEAPELPSIRDYFAPNKKSLSIHVLFYLECGIEPMSSLFLGITTPFGLHERKSPSSLLTLVPYCFPSGVFCSIWSKMLRVQPPPWPQKAIGLVFLLPTIS